MIKLSKVEEPQVLVENGPIWMATLLAKLNAGLEPTAHEKSRYRHKEIKSSLEKETSGKCAYCESKLKHIHHGDVEHIFPKSLDPSKQFLWNNLTLACEICNQNKSNKDPNLLHIIDPYVVDPHDHILFAGSLAYARGTAEGTSSIALLDLNRPALLEVRNEVVRKVAGIFETILRDDIQFAAKRALLENVISNDAGPAGQYSAMVKCLILAIKSHLPEAVVADLI